MAEARNETARQLFVEAVIDKKGGRGISATAGPHKE